MLICNYNISKKKSKIFFFIILLGFFIGKNLYGNVGKISPIDRTKFWSIIDNAKNENQKETLKALEEQLETLSGGELVQFSFILELFAKKLDFPAMQMAHKIINGSHDQIELKNFYFWIISNGQETYYKALENPDTLSKIDVIRGTAYFDKYHYLINNLFSQAGEAAIEDFTLSDDQLTDLDKDTIFNDEKYELDYKEFYNLLPVTLPKLYEKYWNQRTKEEIESDKIHEEQLKI